MCEKSEKQINVHTFISFPKFERTRPTISFMFTLNLFDCLSVVKAHAFKKYQINDGGKKPYISLLCVKKEILFLELEPLGCAHSSSRQPSVPRVAVRDGVSLECGQGSGGQHLADGIQTKPDAMSCSCFPRGLPASPWPVTHPPLPNTNLHRQTT